DFFPSIGQSAKELERERSDGIGDDLRRRPPGGVIERGPSADGATERGRPATKPRDQRRVARPLLAEDRCTKVVGQDPHAVISLWRECRRSGTPIQGRLIQAAQTPRT